MADNDEPTELWSDGTPVAPAPLASAPPTPPLAPASRGGPLIWVIGGGILVLVLLVVVLGVLVVRNIGAAKTAPTQPLAASSAAASGSTLAAPSLPPASSSASATVQDAVNQFGLIGVWADDCTQPLSNDNPYETFAATADGAVTDNINMGPGYVVNQYRFDTGQLNGSDQLALNGVAVNDGSGLNSVLQKDANGRMRVLQATDGTGAQLVVNGAFPAGGASSWETKCSGG